MKKLKFGSLLVDKGLSTYEPFLLKVLSSLVVFPDGDNVLNKYLKMKQKIDSISATGIYLRVVDKVPEKPVDGIIYLIDENKEENSFPEAVLVRIVEKLPDVIEKDVVYMIDSSGYTDDGTSEGPSVNLDINLAVSHEHDNYEILNTFDMSQDELLEVIKSEAIAAAVEEAQDIVEDIQEQVTELSDIVGEGTEPIPTETIDDMYD